MLEFNEEAKALQPHFTKRNIRIYQPAKEDLLILRWWMYLRESGEIERLINEDAYDIVSFASMFKPPTYLLYTIDSQGELIQAHWAKPASGRSNETTAFNGVWCHPSIRGKPQQLAFTYITYMAAFCFFPVIIGTTWQPDLIALHGKMGYSVVGVVPDFLGHEQFYFVRVTKQDFIESKLGLAGAKLISKGKH